MDDGQQNAWYAAQAQGASQPNMSWGQFDYSQQQDQSQHQQYGRGVSRTIAILFATFCTLFNIFSDQSYYQQQNPYAQPQGYYGQMFVPGGGTAGMHWLSVTTVAFAFRCSYMGRSCTSKQLMYPSCNAAKNSIF